METGFPVTLYILYALTLFYLKESLWNQRETLNRTNLFCELFFLDGKVENLICVWSDHHSFPNINNSFFNDETTETPQYS